MGGQASRLIVIGGVIDRLRRLSVASVKFFFLFFDKGAIEIAHRMPLVLAMDAAIWSFLPSAGVVSAAAVGVASVAPPSSVVLRPGVAHFVTGDRVHGLRSLRLVGLVWFRPFAVPRPLLVHPVKSSPLALV